jgi:hypothetical protein
MLCPACTGSATIYRCDRCGDIRCQTTGCPGTVGGKKQAASPNIPCHACGKGRYKRL